MKMDRIIERLRMNAKSIRGLVAGTNREQARWKPSPKRWSLLEVINHLHDEECEDFRRRIDLILHSDGSPWPPIDPPAWIEGRRYNDRDVEESLKRFLDERQRSIAWLEDLESPAWDRKYQHPELGEISGGDLVASWLAHDLLHIRQLTRLHFDYISSLTGSYSTDYAGPW